MMRTTLDFAFNYHSRGWMPIPVGAHSKNPNRKGWQNEQISFDDLPRYFSNGSNIGLLLGKPSNELVDIDLDCPEARALASQFLPETKMISGRSACPHSHFWYVAEEAIKSIQLKEPSLKDKDQPAMIVEIRSTGLQTLVAPSIHPSGDQYIWHEFGEPLRIGAKTLSQCVYHLAACALAARHWQCGQRHETSLALSGALLRGGWSVEQTQHFIISAAMAANDEEAQERGRNVVTTAERIRSGEAATGQPKLVELLGERIVEKLRLWLTLPTSGNEPPKQNKREVQRSERQASKVVCLADVKPEKVEYLWHPYIPKNKFTFIEGDPGVGKSWLTCALASATAAGSGIAGWHHSEPSNVLMLSNEDGLSDTIRPRLDSMKADVNRIFALEGALVFDDRGLLELESRLIEYNPVLVIVDPIVAYLGAGVDMHRANETRAVTSRLAALAEKYQCAIVAVRHLTKGGKDRAIYRGQGSIDFTAACRSVLLVGCDPEDQSKRVIAHIKNNLSEKGVSIGYEITDGVFYWTGESSITADQILGAISSTSDRLETSEAREFLKEVLANGERPAKETEKEAASLGITKSQLRTARHSLGVLSKKIGQPGKGRQGWMWSLPTQTEDANYSTTFSEDAKGKIPSHLRANSNNKSLYENNLAEDVNSPSPSHLREDSSHLREEFIDCPVDGVKGLRFNYCEKCGEFLH